MRNLIIATAVLGFSTALAQPKKPAAPAAAPAEETATAELKNAKGEKAGVALFEQTPNGVLVTAEVSGLAPGTHAFHIHETGKCEPPFKTAGGHFNPGGKKHGLKSAEGCHAGDLPNIYVGADGTAHMQFLAPGVTLKPGDKTSLLDADGSTLVIHAGPDDFKSDPAGNAGDRVVCGVVAKK